MKMPFAKNVHRIILSFLFSLSFISSGLAQNPSDVDPAFKGWLGTFNSLLRGAVPQPDGKILAMGQFTRIGNTEVGGVVRLNTDGTLDSTFLQNIGVGAKEAANAVVTMTVTDAGFQSDNKIILSGRFSFFNNTPVPGVVRLNTDGTIDHSFDLTGMGSNGYINDVLVLPDDKIILVGTFSYYNNIARGGIIRLNSNGAIDYTFNPGTGANSSIEKIVRQTDGKLLVAGSFTSWNGSSANRLVRLNADGTQDASLSIGTGFDERVLSIALQTDDKILVSGQFSNYNGSAVKEIVRLNSDGTQDNTFSFSQTSLGDIYSILPLSDGTILIGGNFSFSFTYTQFCKLQANGSMDPTFVLSKPCDMLTYSIFMQSDGKIVTAGFSSRNMIARWNATGVFDPTFAAGIGAGNVYYASLVQPDGKIVVGGDFKLYNVSNSNYLMRLNRDGSIDNSFNLGIGLNGVVRALLLQPDGKILVAGGFSSFDGTACSKIIRLNSNGTLDPTFSSDLTYGPVYALALQPDGKILAGGAFIYPVVNSYNLIRLNSDGSLDPSFNNGRPGPDYNINAIALQPDGKIVIGGQFQNYDNVQKLCFARINQDGTLDTSFTSSANFYVNSLLLQPDGRILLGGIFNSYNGIIRNSLVRVHNNGALDLSFNTPIALGSSINTLVYQEDHKILVGGYLYSDSAYFSNLLRLNSDGTLDTQFETEQGNTFVPRTMNLLPSGKIFTAGELGTYKGVYYQSILLLKGDPTYLNKIKGNVFTDANLDCQLQPAETKVSSVLIEATPGPYYGNSDNNGNYLIRVDSGAVTYTVSQKLNERQARMFVNQCAPSHTVATSGASKEFSYYDFADTVRECRLLSVEIKKMRMRRCFRSTTTVDYCNYGNLDASNVEIKIEYPPHLTPISSVPAWTSKNGSVLTYQVASLEKETCGSILLIDSVNCGDESIRGLTECIKATISPVSNCEQEDPAWDKSSIKVTGTCAGDSVSFVVRNDGSGNMTASRQYRLYVNDTLVFQDNFQLNTLEQFMVKYPGEKQTIRLEADQHSKHPGHSLPRATVEQCGMPQGIPFPTKLVTTVPQDDRDEEVSFACLPIVDSYDPNDKLVVPAGTGPNHQVPPGEELEFTIRFQNTGSDTAYTVKIIDTLDTDLDIPTFTQLASSHPYRLSVTGKIKPVLTFEFYNINLPDSTTNQLGSNGFVSYRINVPANSPIGTQIRNRAYIYFDYNSAILTNETEHTVGITTEEDLSKGARVKVENSNATSTGVFMPTRTSAVKLYPNPTDGTLYITTTASVTEMKVFSMEGMLQRTIKLKATPLHEVNLEGLKPGMYLCEFWQNDTRLAVEPLQIQK